MALVVILHVSLWFEYRVDADASAMWASVNGVFAPLRMPLFFFISGMLAAPSLSKPFSSTRRKTFGLYYVYAIWTFLFAARLWIPAARSGPEKPHIGELLLGFVLPTSLWFLWALPVFFLISSVSARVLGRFASTALLPFAVLALVSPVIESATINLASEPTAAIMLGSVASNLVWFYAGTCGKAAWLGSMVSARWWKFLLCTVIYVTLYATLVLADLTEVLRFILAPIALLAAAQFLALVDMRSPISRAFRWLGELTLPVYIFHFVALTVLTGVATLTPIFVFTGSNPLLWGAVLPPTLALAIVLASRTMGQLILRSRFRWLLAAPDWVVGASRPLLRG